MGVPLWKALELAKRLDDIVNNAGAPRPKAREDEK